MKKWTIAFTSLWNDPKEIKKICDIPPFSIINATGNSLGNYEEVIYITSKEFKGWIWAPYTEELTHEFPEAVQIEKQTPSEQDAAQYIIWDGNIQYNLCGELCICYIFGKSLSEFLEHWKAMPNSVYHKIFHGGKSRTTSVSDLINMAKSCGEFESITIKNALGDLRLDRILVSPRRFQRWLEQGYKPILGVKIEGQKGRLKSNGNILHWIVLTKIIPDGVNNGWVELYNPFPNRVESYSWQEFLTAMGTPMGIFLKEIKS